MAVSGNAGALRALRAPRAWVALRVDLSLLVPVVVAGIVAYLTVVPVVMQAWSSLQSGTSAGAPTLANYARIYSNPLAHQLLLTSFLFAAGSALLSTTAGGLLAWFVERTNLPLRSVFFAAALAPLIMPGSLSTFAWVLLLSPNIGVINVAAKALFGLAEPPFNPYALGGMIWVEGLNLSPLGFLLIAGAMRSMDANLEEAAFTSGASVAQTVRRITVPLLLPAFASTLLLSFVRGLEAFEVPAMLGIPGKVYVFAAYLFQALNQFPVDYPAVGTYATSMLALSMREPSCTSAWWRVGGIRPSPARRTDRA